MSTWKQFSIWDEKWPYRAITDFLPRLKKEIIDPLEVRWHFLYEPNLLVRIETESPILTDVDNLANYLGYKSQAGDMSKDKKVFDAGLYFFGDVNFYGERLWEANADFLHAVSNLIIVMQETGKLTPSMLRKHVHLFCNQSGKNYLQEFWFLLRMSFRSFRLFLKFGFN